MWYIVMSVSQGEPKYLFLPCTLTSILYSPLLSSITMCTWYIVMSASQGEPKYLFLPCTDFYTLQSIVVINHHVVPSLTPSLMPPIIIMLSCAHRTNITYFYFS